MKHDTPTYVYRTQLHMSRPAYDRCNAIGPACSGEPVATVVTEVFNGNRKMHISDNVCAGHLSSLYVDALYDAQEKPNVLAIMPLRAA